MKRILLSFVVAIFFFSLASAGGGPFLFVFLNTNPDKPELPKEQVDSIMKGHLANIERLAKEGKLIAAGPFFDGGGIFVLATESRDTAWEWLRTDPGVRANRWIIELMPYRPRVGSVCSVGENYEMVGYGFVRYKAMAKTTGLAGDGHLDYLRSFVPVDSVVAEGVFGEGEGSILVIRGEPDKGRLNMEPAVVNGEVEVSVKKLWIARGAFCEK
ncbi:MAG TPA: YciI family protein [Bacteroidota bacterium]